jgi:hypothetical protein
LLLQQQQLHAHPQQQTNNPQLDSKPQPASAQDAVNSAAPSVQQQTHQKQQQEEQELLANRISDSNHVPASADSMLQQKYKFIKHLGGGAFGAVVQASGVGHATYS